MPNYITTRQYADLHGLPIETVRTWTKCNKIPFIKVGDSIMIECDTPIPAKKKSGRKPMSEQAKVVKPKYKIEITRAYYVAVVDNSGKEVTSDFTFLNKQEAEKLGKKLKAEVENRG